MKRKSTFLFQFVLMTCLTMLSRAAIVPVASFNKCIEISFPGFTAEEETLVNFPMPIVIDPDVIENFSYRTCNPDDIVFVSEDGDELAYEIEKWDSAGKSYIWVKIPSLTIGTKIKMYYGQITAYSRVTNPTDVWSEYVAVWHMVDPEKTGVVDSTGNGHTLIPSIKNDQLIPSSDSKFGSAVMFPAVNQGYTVNSIRPYLNGALGLSIETLLTHTAEPNGNNRIISYRSGSNTPLTWQFTEKTQELQLQIFNNGNSWIKPMEKNTKRYAKNSTGSAWSAASFSLVKSPTASNGVITHFVDGVKDVHKTSNDDFLYTNWTKVTMPLESAYDFCIGMRYQANDTPQGLNGYLDELRISTSTTRTPLWHATFNDSLMNSGYVQYGAAISTIEGDIDASISKCEAWSTTADIIYSVLNMGTGATALDLQLVYSTDENFETATTNSVSITSIGRGVYTISGLEPASTYYVCALMRNNLVPAKELAFDLEFTTQDGIPEVTIDSNFGDDNKLGISLSLVKDAATPITGEVWFVAPDGNATLFVSKNMSQGETISTTRDDVILVGKQYDTIVKLLYGDGQEISYTNSYARPVVPMHEIWVDCNSTVSDGTEEHPFRTLGEAAISSIAGKKVPQNMGTTIHVAPGRYLLDGTLEFPTEVRLYSNSGNPADTIIDGQGKYRCIRSSYLVIRGFTVCNGFTGPELKDRAGAGLRDSGSDGSRYNQCQIFDCIFSNNVATAASGAGAYIEGSWSYCAESVATWISNCVFVANVVTNNVWVDEFIKGYPIGEQGLTTNNYFVAYGTDVDAWAAQHGIHVTGVTTNYYPTLYDDHTDDCYGGGLRFGQAAIVDCKFIGNTAFRGAGMVSCGQAGSFYPLNPKNLVFSNNVARITTAEDLPEYAEWMAKVVKDNKTGSWPGYTGGSAVYQTTYSLMTMRFHDSVFCNNTTILPWDKELAAGAIVYRRHNQMGSPSFDRCEFYGNAIYGPDGVTPYGKAPNFEAGGLSCGFYMSNSVFRAGIAKSPTDEFYDKTGGNHSTAGFYYNDTAYVTKGEIFGCIFDAGEESSAPAVKIIGNGVGFMNNVAIRNCFFRGGMDPESNSYAVHIGYSKNAVEIDNCTFVSGGTALSMNFGQTNILSNCLFLAPKSVVHSEKKDATVTNVTAIACAGTEDLNALFGGTQNRKVYYYTRLVRDFANGDFMPCRQAQDTGVRLYWMDAESVDIAGNPRVAANAPDLGCYENFVPKPGISVIIK